MATAAASVVLLLAALAALAGPSRCAQRHDHAVSGALCPVRGAPLGELCLTGLRLAGAPFVIRVGRLGLAMVEGAADGVRLGV
ncbi:hypothetical protein ACGFX8_07345 [Streptomyces sp. NPDC048362]|uniref:hypothetical protein n=1 Tax=Streptomyces sp. NPDC048362 TaxID=3365539 RepID=UPI0037132CDC